MVLGNDAVKRRDLLTIVGAGALAIGGAAAKRPALAQSLGQIINPDFANRIKIIDDDFRLAYGGQAALANWYTQPLASSPFGEQVWEDVKPFAITAAGLVITATRDGSGTWHSGMLNSVNPDGTQGRLVAPFFYAEAVLALPSVAGTWPGFWFNSVAPGQFTANEYPTFEIDAMENPNGDPNAYVAAVHRWNDPNYPPAQFVSVPAGTSPFTAFHKYHVEVNWESILMGFDGKWVWQIPRDQDVPGIPFACMVDFAMGGGWPVPTVAGPLKMKVQRVKVYS